MTKKKRSFYREEKGEGVFSFVFLLFIGLILMLLSVSIYQAYTIQSNLQTACTETLQLMKAENGADEKTKRKFIKLLDAMKIPAHKVEYSATQKSDGLQRGDSMTVTATMHYDVFALKAIGRSYILPITASAHGFAHKFVREGE